MKYYTVIWGLYIINHERRIPIKQPVFQWKVSEGFFRGSLESSVCESHLVDFILPEKYNMSPSAPRKFYTPPAKYLCKVVELKS